MSLWPNELYIKYKKQIWNFGNIGILNLSAGLIPVPGDLLFDLNFFRNSLDEMAVAARKKNFFQTFRGTPRLWIFCHLSLCVSYLEQCVQILQQIQLDRFMGDLPLLSYSTRYSTEFLFRLFLHTSYIFMTFLRMVNVHPVL